MGQREDLEISISNIEMQLDDLVKNLDYQDKGASMGRQSFIDKLQMAKK